MGELRVFSRAALTRSDEVRERTGVDRLYMLVDPEHGGPEVFATGKTGEYGVWLYSGLELLVESCGEGQPYVPVTPSELVEFADGLDVTLLVSIDMWHPEGARYPEPDRRDFDPLEPLDSELPEEPLVWIPTRPVGAGDRRATAELYGTRVGEKLLLVFESSQQAQQACGPFQPLASIRADRIDAVAHECGAHGVVVNGVLAEEARHRAPVRDWLREGRDGRR